MKMEKRPPFILKHPVVLLMAAMLAIGTGLAKGQDSSPSSAPGRNIGRFFDKLRAGRSVTIGFLGEGATYGLGASRPGREFRSLITLWLRAQYPNARIETIDASIPGTGSLYGTLRLRRDLLASKPDLVLIEFGLSDAAENQVVVRKAIEGMLRQLLVVPQPPEIVLLHPASPDRIVPTEASKSMAGQYGIPTIDLQSALRPMIESGSLTTATLWPRNNAAAGALTDAGHQLYADRIIDFLKQQSTLAATPLARNIPPPVASDELNYGELRALAESRTEPGASAPNGAVWKKERSDDPHSPTLLMVSDRPGATLETYFEGTVVGLTFIKGRSAGMIEVLIDGQPAPAPLRIVDCYDERTGLGTAIIAGGLPLGEHKLTIRLLPGRHPRSRGQEVKLGYLIIGGQRPEKL